MQFHERVAPTLNVEELDLIEVDDADYPVLSWATLSEDELFGVQERLEQQGLKPRHIRGRADPRNLEDDE